MHHLMITWDLEYSVCHLLMKHRGSILHNCLCFAALILLLDFYPYSEYFDICQEGEIEGVIGRGTGRETRGWGCGRAQREGHISQFRYYTPCYVFFFRILCWNVFKKTLFFQFIFCIFYLSLFLADESTEEEAPWPLTKEEEDINTLQNWIQLGGFPTWPEEEAWGLLVDIGYSTLFFCCSSDFSVVVLLLCFHSDLSLQGLQMLKWASSLHKDACRLDVEAQHLEKEGLAKMEAAVAGSEAEGFYGLLRGAISHSSLPTSTPPPKRAHHAPSTTVSLLPIQEATWPEASAPMDQALESASLAVSPAPEEENPAHMQPLCIQLRASKGCTDVRLRTARRAHQPLALPSVLTYERYIWEWGRSELPPDWLLLTRLRCSGLCSHLGQLWQVFLQSWYLPAPQERSY